MAVQPPTIGVSESFDVRQTEYGRACFATRKIERGVEVLITNHAFGATILHEFRKEVCSTCFHYEYGQYCKWKLPTPRSFNEKWFLGAGLWFCSEECVEKWLAFDPQEVFTLTLETMLSHFQRGFKSKNEEQECSISITESLINGTWDEVEQWDQKLIGMKKTKQMNHMPKLNEEEYVAARFAALTLFHLHTNHASSALFEQLQSNELEKISRFPVLLQSQTDIYKFLRLSLPESLQPLLTIDSLRQTFGREYGNAFGMRQITEQGSVEEKEFLGYLLYPEASFFNHSCAPNLLKSRSGDKMVFRALQTIQQGEQLCIDYFQISAEPLAYRQKTLKENWFFECACDRCKSELSVQEGLLQCRF